MPDLPRDRRCAQLTLKVHLLALGEHPAAPDAERAQRVVVLLAGLWGQSEGPVGAASAGVRAGMLPTGSPRARSGERPVLWVPAGSALWEPRLGTEA